MTKLHWTTCEGGLSDDTIRRLKLGYAPGNTLARAMFEQGVSVEKLLEIGLYTPRGFEKLAGYVILPVIDGDDTVFMQGRSPQKNPEQKHDSLPEGLAHKLPMAIGHPRLGSIVAEGSFDFATPIQWGLNADFGIVGLLGTGHNLALSLRADWLVSPVILGLDQDCAGKRVALQMQVRLAETGKRVLIPVDVDRLKAAQSFISACTDRRQPLSVVKQKRFKSASEHIELVDEIYKMGCQVEVHWGGRKDLNDLLRWGRAGRDAFQPLLNAAV
jgi:DNA primase